MSVERIDSQAGGEIGDDAADCFGILDEGLNVDGPRQQEENVGESDAEPGCVTRLMQPPVNDDYANDCHVERQAERAAHHQPESDEPVHVEIQSIGRLTARCDQQASVLH